VGTAGTFEGQFAVWYMRTATWNHLKENTRLKTTSTCVTQVLKSVACSQPEHFFMVGHLEKEIAQFFLHNYLKALKKW